METTTKTDAAMTAAGVTCARTWAGSTTLHAGTSGRLQGTGLSVVGIDVRDRGYAFNAAAADAPAMGSASPRLEGPPV
ncbi:hypothetical protein JQN72_13270 [Phycicoccus sp. CSK15P-2]|uniref:hypothetical protein n=1 Tax=Phycicoccus sp. CSK15P-2 TaxID=2807627 RepID=UPI00194F823E|nr:hypothetical protein [Phycicoccus sp. CSK15P-2]MBM6405211.1 hypothetical protein [Phycicoccus sp. CSK15P-2]